MSKKEFFKLTPFKMQVLQSFPFIDADFDALTNYELLCKVVEYLNITVDNVNLLNDDFKTLYNYVHDYFDNLDVQEEINNKLDDMAESGELADIIAQYLGLAGVLSFNNVASMKTATNLVDGSTAHTLGYYNINDGGDSYYKIRTITNDDIVDEKFIIALNDNTLIAELVYNDSIYIKQIGAKGNNTDDDSPYIISALSKVNKIIFNSGSYYINDDININKDNVTLEGISYRSSNLLFGDNGSINFIGTSITASGTHRKFLTIDSLRLENKNWETERETPYLNLICCAYIKILNSWITGKGKQVLMWECFDSRITNTDIEWGGSTDNDIIGIELRSTNGGNSSLPTYEYTNNIYFYGCRFESHVGKCVASTGTNTNKIIFESCKFESFNCLAQNAIRFTNANNIYFTDCVFAGSLANTKNYVYIDSVNDFKIDGYAEHSQGTYSNKKMFYLAGSGRRVVSLRLSNNNEYDIDYKTFGFESFDNNIYINGSIQVNNMCNKDILVTDRGITIATLESGSTTLNYTILENGFLYVTAVGTYGETTPQVVTIKDNTINKECNVLTIGSQYITNCMPVSKGDVITCTKNTMATVYVSILYNRGFKLN